MPPKQSDPQFKLRIPADLKARIERSAKENNRALSAEILNTLEYYYPEPISVEETVRDIEQSLRFIRMLRSPSLFQTLAEQIDALVFQVSEEGLLTPEAREEALRVIRENAAKRDAHRLPGDKDGIDF